MLGIAQPARGRCASFLRTWMSHAGARASSGEPH
jgi:hypothetical protein